MIWCISWIVGNALQERRDGTVVAQYASASELVAHFIVFFGNEIFQFDRQLIGVRRQKFKNENVSDFFETIVSWKSLLDPAVDFGVASVAETDQTVYFSDFDFKYLRTEH